MKRYLVLFSLITFSLSFKTSAYEPTSEQKAVAWCVSQGAVDPKTFSICVAKSLTKAEIKKCLSGKGCFGKNNEIRKVIEQGVLLGINLNDIQHYGICGGRNSEVRKIFGSACKPACGKGDKGFVRIINPTIAPLNFAMESRCGSFTNITIQPNWIDTYGGVPGDMNYSLFVNSPGAQFHYNVEVGRWYRFEWQGNALTLVDETPQYNP